MDIDQQTGHGGSLDCVCRARREDPEVLFRSGHVAGQELAFGSMKLQLEHQIVASLPTVAGYQG